MTKCDAFAKFVKKMRKSEKKAKKEKYKQKAEKRRIGSELGNLSFRCPVKKCTHIFTKVDYFSNLIWNADFNLVKVDEIVKHVEHEHSPREFMVFMMGDEFLDFLGKQCERCKFLYQRKEGMIPLLKHLFKIWLSSNLTL